MMTTITKRRGDIGPSVIENRRRKPRKEEYGSLVQAVCMLLGG